MKNYFIAKVRWNGHSWAWLNPVTRKELALCGSMSPHITPEPQDIRDSWGENAPSIYDGWDYKALTETDKKRVASLLSRPIIVVSHDDDPFSWGQDNASEMAGMSIEEIEGTWKGGIYG